MTTYPSPAGTVELAPVTSDTLLELVDYIRRLTGSVEQIADAIGGQDIQVEAAQKLGAEIERFRAALDPTLPGSSETTT